MREECLICKAPLEYLLDGIEMECVTCHKKKISSTRCVNGHFVCDECHTKGVDQVLRVCLDECSADPYQILVKLMALPFCHMHGPEHHIMVGSALLTAYRNAGGSIELEKALMEMQARGKKVPGGICGFWGSCGAAVSAGIFVSIITGSTPLASKEWGFSNLMTSAALHAIGTVGGPRCCKRNSYLAITEAVKFIKENFGVEMTLSPIRCSHQGQNNQCIGTRCPFHRKGRKYNDGI